jgi:hypothetical protein
MYFSGLCWPNCLVKNLSRAAILARLLFFRFREDFHVLGFYG